MSRFGFSDELLNDIIGILSKRDNVKLAMIFGSRARGDYKNNSDIDICIFGDIPAIELNLIIDELKELNTSLDFDVVNFEKTKKEELKKNILKDGVTIYERTSNSQI